jgi:hypothetical protein
VTYSFRNRFRLPGGDRLDADVREIKLADSADDGLVTLQAAEEMRVSERTALISEASELVVQGSGYVDADTAAAAGRKWRQYLTVALARERKGVDFGPDDRVIPVADIVYDDEPPMLLQQIGVGVGDRAIIDDYQLLVFPTEPMPKFVNFVMGTPTVKVSDWLERLKKRISDASERNHQPWNRQKSLAYRLVVLALRDSNPETRHIQQVTAIEVLLDERDRPQPVLDALKNFLDEVERWPDSEKGLKQRMTEILNEDKEESITRAGSEQVAAMLDGKYFDRDAGRFFKDVYNMRSGLVHREKPKKPRPKIDDIREVQSELQRFVLDLLDAYESG